MKAAGPIAMSRMTSAAGGCFAVALALLLALQAATAQPATIGDFYRGKTITIVIGYSAGGGYEIFARCALRAAS